MAGAGLWTTAARAARAAARTRSERARVARARPPETARTRHLGQLRIEFGGDVVHEAPRLDQLARTGAGRSARRRPHPVGARGDGRPDSARRIGARARRGRRWCAGRRRGRPRGRRRSSRRPRSARRRRRPRRRPPAPRPRLSATPTQTRRALGAAGRQSMPPLGVDERGARAARGAYGPNVEELRAERLDGVGLVGVERLARPHPPDALGEEALAALATSAGWPGARRRGRRSRRHGGPTTR